MLRKEQLRQESVGTASSLSRADIHLVDTELRATVSLGRQKKSDSFCGTAKNSSSTNSEIRGCEPRELEPRPGGW